MTLALSDAFKHNCWVLLHELHDYFVLLSPFRLLYLEAVLDEMRKDDVIRVLNAPTVTAL